MNSYKPVTQLRKWNIAGLLEAQPALFLSLTREQLSSPSHFLQANFHL